MSEYQTHENDTQPDPAEPSVSVDDAVETGSEHAQRRVPWWGKVLIGIGVLIGLLVVGAFLLYNFGGMGGSVYDPQIEQRYDQLVESGEVAPIEQRFVIPIPGCTCHSDDPYLTEQHRNRRIRDCSGCHSR